MKLPSFKFLSLSLLCVITVNGNTWQQVGSDIQSEYYQAGNGWYTFVSMAFSDDGTTLAISSINNSNNKLQIEVFNWSGRIWRESGNVIEVTSISGSTLYNLATNISLNADGTVLAVSLISADDTIITQIFQLANQIWQKVGNDISVWSNSAGKYVTDLKLNNDGQSIAIYSIDFYQGISKLSVYEWSGASWMQVGVDLNQSNTLIGNTIGGGDMSADGNTLLHYFLNEDNATTIGKIYQWTGINWQQIGADIVGEHDPNSNGNSENFCYTLSGDGNTVAVSSGGGSIIKVYQLNNGNWLQVGDTINIELGGIETYSWTKVSLDFSGSILASSDLRACRLFELVDDTWLNIGDPISIQDVNTYFKATELSLSGNGEHFAVNTWNTNFETNDGQRYGFGRLRVYAPPVAGPPILQLEDFYEQPNGSSRLVDATPLLGFPTVFTYQWYLNGNLISEELGGTASSYAIQQDVNSEGTWRVEVTNEEGTGYAEFEYRLFVDSDLDGYSDYRESNYLGTNPNDADTDGDGLSDYAELETHNTLPTQPDSNNDGFSDGVIHNMGLNLNTDYSALSQDLIDSLRDIRVGSTMIEVSQGRADITMTLEETSDLSDWSSGTTSEKTIEVDAPAGTRFFRFKMAE